MNFRFLNIPVHIHPSFWLFLLFFTGIYRDPSMESVILGVVMFVSLLVHEYGHALTAALFGARPTVVLEAFGGRAQYSGQGLSPRQQFWITLNGPLLESCLIGLAYFFLQVGSYSHYVEYFLQMTIRLNTLWIVLNLLPVMPLDGGYLVRYALQRKFGEKGVRASVIVGLVCALAAGPFLFYLGFMFFGMLVLMFAWQNFQELCNARVSVENTPFKCYTQGLEALKNNDLEGAKLHLKKVVCCKDPQMENSAKEALAKVYVLEKQGDAAYELLQKADFPLLKEGKSLLCKLAFERGNFSLVSTHAVDAYAQDPSFEVAMMNSKAFAQLNDGDFAGGWLKTAAQFGENYKELAKRELATSDFALVREHELFQEQIRSIF